MSFATGLSVMTENGLLQPSAFMHPVSMRTGRTPKYRVELRPNYGRAKLNGRQVAEIRRLRAKEHLTMRELSNRFGVSIRAISDILNHKTYAFYLPDNIKLEK